ETMKELRRLHRRLTLARRPFLGALTYPVRIYIETLVNSVRLFVLVLLLWVLGLSVVYYYFSPDPTAAAPDARWDRALLESVTNFFSIQPPVGLQEIMDRQPEGLVWITMFAVVLAFV